MLSTIPFMDKDFLLYNPTAKQLYHEHAAKMPILDYHCHINPREIFEDKHFENITQVWLTDSRSFLSYTRHEYLRRILCQLIGEWVEMGEYPADMVTLGVMVEDICHNNAKRYFNL